MSSLPPHKGKTSRCHLAKNWGLRPQLTICTSQMSVQRGVLQPPGPQGAQTRSLRGFSVGRQVGTAAQGILKGSCSLLPKPPLLWPPLPSHSATSTGKIKLNSDGPWCPHKSVPPKSLSHPPGRRAGELEEMLHRWRPCPWWVQA